MQYLRSFTLPSGMEEDQFLSGTHKLLNRVYNTVYPFEVFPARGLQRVSLEPITVFCGGNGSGKTTLLNVMADTLGIGRGTDPNRSDFYEDYLHLARSLNDRASLPEGSRLLTSDDVFDYILNLRALNDGIDRKRPEVYEEYQRVKAERFQLRSMADYEHLKAIVSARRTTRSAYTREHLGMNAPERSNGESAFMVFTREITENRLYLLDEPENSLSVCLQQELADYLANSVRFYGCQLVLSTHSPIFMAMPHARVYDMDACPVCVRPWNELENVRAMQAFFRAHDALFPREEEPPHG